MSKQVLDIEQMRHLKDLGVDTSKAYWSRVVRLKEDSDSKSLPISSNGNGLCLITENVEKIPIFTLQDILDLLPKSIEYYGQLQIHFCEMPEGMYANRVVYSTIKGNQIEFFYKDVIDSAYEMLCWCIENGYVKTNKED